MSPKDIVEFLDRGGGFLITNLLKQHWEKDKYSYITNPRQDYGLLLLISGEVKFTSKEQTMTVKKGDVVYLPKNSFYEAIFEDKADDYLINFDIEAKEKSVCSSAPMLLLRNASASCFKYFFELVEENFVEKKNSLRSRGRFYLLWDSIANHAFEFSSIDARTVERAKDMLYGAEELSISEIALKCGISESGLRRKFKEIVGVSPREYRMSMKLNRAKYLLESTDMSVSDISDSLNFYDSAYFCKTFKSHTGVTPMEYSKNKSL